MSWMLSASNDAGESYEEDLTRFYSLVQDVSNALDMDIDLIDEEILEGRKSKKVYTGHFYMPLDMKIEHSFYVEGELRVVVDVVGDLVFYIQANESSIMIHALNMKSISNLTRFFKRLNEIEYLEELDDEMLARAVKKWRKQAGEDQWREVREAKK